ncbi:hypothetical protein [Deinococcus aquiradiocola]|uniref:Uncharacterized protein n=1 Tax=Deinococcus aquiradiocola TaxID=393059 RepID=A0A917UKS2_9DEIO|nr:hypothetical protein [Deinococcus aquiradiocola]GGJ64711.1 hypothetical protein GCM10008939_05750 [Deinococcus aquiradiocola]
MNRPLRLALSLTLLLSATPARATTFTSLTLAQQARKADVIVQATIGTPTSVTEAGNTYAVYPLKVSETLAGDAAMLPQTVGAQNGDSPALFVLSGVDRAPVFQLGQEVVLLLYKGRLDSPLVGYNQGAYLVDNGTVSVLFPPLQPGAAQPVPFQSGPVQSGPVSPANTTVPAPNSPAATTPVTTTPVTSATTVPANTPPATVGTAAPTTLPASSPDVPGGVTVPPTTVPQPSTATQPSTTLPPVTPPGTTPADSIPVPAPAVTAAPTLSPPAGTNTPGATGGTVTASPVAAGVLGSIRTPAELKAAIVAARSAR